MQVTVDIVSAKPLGAEKGPVMLEMPNASQIRDLVVELIFRFGESMRERLVQKQDGEPYVSFIVDGDQVDLN